MVEAGNKEATSHLKWRVQNTRFGEKDKAAAALKKAGYL